MAGPCWANVSTVAKDLVRRLLDINPVTRFSAQQVIEHECFTEDMMVVNRARKMMGLEIVMDNSDVGESSKQLGTKKLRGEKRKLDVDTEGGDGARTIRMKAREKRKTEMKL